MTGYVITENGCWRAAHVDAKTAHDESCRMRARLRSQGYYDAEVRVVTTDEYKEMVQARNAQRARADMERVRNDV